MGGGGSSRNRSSQDRGRINDPLAGVSSVDFSDKEAVMGLFEDKIEAKVSEVPLTMAMSFATGLADLVEDEIIPKPIPLKVSLSLISYVFFRHIEVRISAILRGMFVYWHKGRKKVFFRAHVWNVIFCYWTIPRSQLAVNFVIVHCPFLSADSQTKMNITAGTSARRVFIL